jgi:hypothetical protein
LLFLALFYLCLWRGVEVGLLYHARGEIRDFPVFFWGADFVRDFLRYPGGSMDYLAALGAQFLFFSWLGALMLTAQGAIMFLAARACARQAGWNRPCVAALAAPLLLLWVYARYAHYAGPVASWTGAALALLALARFGPASAAWRLALVVGLCGLLYPAAAGALPVFLLTAALWEWHRGRAWARAVVVLLLGAVVACLEGTLGYGLGLEEIGQSLTPLPARPACWTQPGILPLCLLYLLLPALGPLVWLGRWPLLRSLARRLGARATELPKGASPSATASAPGRKVGRGRARPLSGGPRSTAVRWRRALPSAGLAAAVLAVFYAAHDRDQKPGLLVDYYASQHRWAEALAAARGQPLGPLAAGVAAQAAYHTGRLGQQLPTVPTADALLLSNPGMVSHWQQGDLYLDLGYVTSALHHLTEAVENWGERPGLLRGLAVANLALGNTATARIYLHALERVPFQSGWARRYLARLTDDSLPAGDPEVQRLRSLMVRQDTVAHPNAEEQLLLLLAANPANRMAFDYLMTYYLLSKNLDSFARRFGHLRDFPNAELPPLWEEALVLWARSRRQDPPRPVPPGWAACEQRLDRLLRVYEASGRNAETARREVQTDYADSYFYYYFFHR